MLGNIYRSALIKFNVGYSLPHMIGSFGPFKIDGYFSFSDFKSWGGKHNNGFKKCVSMAKDKKCFVDIGAHIGLVTLPVSRAMPNGIILSIEPSDINRHYLNRHLELNNISNVEVLNCVVADEHASINFHEANEPCGMNSTHPKKALAGMRSSIKEQKTLDQICAERSLLPDLIKIDVEGAEIKVLRGAKVTLSKGRPHIFLSVHPTEIALQGGSLEELQSVIDEFDYKVTTINSENFSGFKLSEYLLVPKEETDAGDSSYI